MRTMGTVKINTNPAPSRVLDDSEKAARNSRPRMRCSATVSNAATSTMNAGR